MKHFKIILSLLVVAAVALSMSLVSCSPSPQQDQGGGGGGGSTTEDITLIFDFTGTYLPEDYGVKPFLVGGLGSSINTNEYYDWDKVTNGGIKQDGTGSHILTKIDSAKWKFVIPKSKILADPNTPTAVEFKVANYNPAGWNGVVSDFWNTIGSQLTGLNNEKIVISNYAIIEAYKPGDTNAVKPGESARGITLSQDGKTLTIKVAEHGGWSVHIAYNVTNVQLVLITSNVATNKGTNPVTEYGYSGTFNGWAGPEPATILSTNANGRVVISATIANYTGSGKVEYKVRGKVSGNWEWAAGANLLAIIPQGVTRYTNYVSEDINF